MEIFRKSSNIEVFCRFVRTRLHKMRIRSFLLAALLLGCVHFAYAQQQETSIDLLEKYKSAIKAKIAGNVVLPRNIVGNPEAIVWVVLLPDGVVLTTKLVQTSGNAAYDQAIERAITNASPLPVPQDFTLFMHFRELTLNFRPRE
jgi:TolA protein